MKNKLVGYAAVICGGIAFVLIFLAYSGAFTSDDPLRIYRCLSDAFFAPAVVYLGIAALHALSLTGSMDMMTYSFRNFFRLFRRKMQDDKLPADYYDYVKERQGRKFQLWNLLWTGIGFLIVAILFAVLYSFS